MLRAVLVDDEPLALRRLEIALMSQSDVRIVGKVNDARNANALIADIEPDLLFVDIQMPGMSGLDLVDAIKPEKPPAVVFVTAYERFAVDAFENGAVDYVLKPIDEQRLAKAVNRARRARQNMDAEDQIAELRSVVQLLRQNAISQAEASDECDLWVATNGKSLRVPIAQVQCFQAAGDYVKIVTSDAEHLHYDSLRALEKRLDPSRFVRVHRSSIVALPHVVSLTRTRYGGLRIALENGRIVQCSRSNRAIVEQKLGKVG